MKLKCLLGWSFALLLSAGIAQAQETNNAEKFNKQLQELQERFEKQQRELRESFESQQRELREAFEKMIREQLTIAVVAFVISFVAITEVLLSLI